MPKSSILGLLAAIGVAVCGALQSFELLLMAGSDLSSKGMFGDPQTPWLPAAA